MQWLSSASDLKKFGIFSSLLYFSGVSASFADTSNPAYLSVAGGITLTTATISAAQAAAMQTYNMTQSIGLGYAGGVLLAVAVSPEWEFEGGLEFSRRRIDYSLNAVLVGTEHVELSYLELPFIARYRFSPQFAVGGGVYYAQGIGGVSIVSNTPGVPSSSNTSATKNDDFGFVLNSRVDFPVDTAAHAFVDARFLFGILNINSPSATEGNTYFRELEILGGMSFDL